MRKGEGGADKAGLAVAGLVSAALIILFFGYRFVQSPPYWQIAPEANFNFTILALYLERVFLLVLALVVLASAASAGLFVMSRLALAGARPLEQAAISAALGLGALSLVTLVLGAAGLLGFFSCVLILVAFSALGARRLYALGVELFAGQPQEMPSGGDAPGSEGSLTAVERVLVAVLLAGSLLILMYAFNPPMNFDALEYHLGAPAIYFHRGSIGYIEYNVYSNFPANASMLYLFSMELIGSRLEGAMLGKVLNAFAAFLAIATAYSLARWLWSRGAGIFAAVALVTMGGFFQVATGVYVEALQALYTLVALLAAGRFLARGSQGWIVVSGLSAGLAFGVKYPSAPFVVLPLAAAALLAPGGARCRLKALAIFSISALAVASPWLIKNIILTGNPVYPLLWGIFGGRDWSAFQQARWAMAHTPKGGLGWQQWARHVLGVLFGEPHGLVSLAAFAFVPFALVGPGRTKRSLFVLAFALLYLFIWFAFTHRIVRFLVPGLTVMAAVSGAGLFSLGPGRIRSGFMAAAVLLVGLSLFYTAGFYGARPDPSVPLFGEYEGFLAENHPAYTAWRRAAAELPEGAYVYLHAEPETFYLDFDFAATTVFDRKLLDEVAMSAPEAEGIAAELLDQGFTHIFVNWATFRRQQETYVFTFEGREHAGYSEMSGPDFFEEMEAAGIISVVFAEGPQVYPGVQACVLYRVVQP